MKRILLLLTFCIVSNIDAFNLVLKQKQLGFRPRAVEEGNSKICRRTFSSYRSNRFTLLESNIENEEANEEKQDQETPPATKSPAGFRTALIMGPPLFIKFLVVLVVKFLTDLVVFPLLFLYRVLRLCKRKTLGLFGISSNSNAKEVDVVEHSISPPSEDTGDEPEYAI